MSRYMMRGRTTTERRTWLTLTAAVVLVAGVGAAIGWRSLDHARAREAITPAALDWPRVEVTPVGIRDLTDTLEVVGTTRAMQATTVSAELAGTIARVHVEIGDVVREGSVLLELRDDAEVAAYEQAVARFEQAQAEHQFAQFDYQGARRLFDEATNRDYGITEMQLRERRQRRDATAANLRAAAAAVQSAREVLRRTVIRAPFTGAISERFIDRGTMVTPGTPLLRIDDLREVTVRLALSDMDIGRLDLESPIDTIRVANRREPYAGRVFAVSPSAGADGLFSVIISLQDAGLSDVDFDDAAWRARRLPLQTESTYVRDVHDRPPLGAVETPGFTAPRQPSLISEHRVLRRALPPDLVFAGMTARVALPRRTVYGAVVVPESAVVRSAADESYVVVVDRDRVRLDTFGPEESVEAQTARRVYVTIERYVGPYAVLGQAAERPDEAGAGRVLHTVDGRELPLRPGEWVVRHATRELRTGDPVAVIDGSGGADRAAAAPPPPTRRAAHDND